MAYEFLKKLWGETKDKKGDQDGTEGKPTRT